MKKFDMLIAIGLLLCAMAAAQAQQSNELERVQAANQKFVAAVIGRDINAIDTAWAHESYASFIGPLSTKVVVGWDGVRQAWQMRFGQFDRVSISMDEPHTRVNGDAAWDYQTTGRNVRPADALTCALKPPSSLRSTTSTVL
jgi:ketosteroid isomerase-like protein